MKTNLVSKKTNRVSERANLVVRTLTSSEKANFVSVKADLASES